MADPAARLAPNGQPGTTVYRAHAAGRLVAEVTTVDGAGVVDELWAALEHAVIAGHRPFLVAYDGATGWPLPIGDRMVAAS